MFLHMLGVWIKCCILSVNGPVYHRGSQIQHAPHKREGEGYLCCDIAKKAEGGSYQVAAMWKLRVRFRVVWLYNIWTYMLDLAFSSVRLSELESCVDTLTMAGKVQECFGSAA